MKRTKKLIVRTPEGIALSLEIAGPVSRFLALVLDVLLVLVATILLNTVLLFASAVSRDAAGALFMLMSFVLSIGYPMFMEWRYQGQTVGKRVLRIQVVDSRGKRLSLTQVIVRNLLRAIDSLPFMYLTGGVSAFLSPSGQRLGDIAASTVVVSIPRSFEPDFARISSDKFNTFFDYPHLVARIRQNVLPAEAGIALRALMRRDNLDPQARLAVFSTIRAHFEKTVAFPEEATSGISDEHYVRNVLDILWSSPAANIRPRTSSEEQLPPATGA